MMAIRALLRARYPLALVLVVLALAVRMLVPAGAMPGSGDKVLAMEICADASGMPHSQLLIIPGKPAPHENSAAKGQCAFAGLAFPALAGTDPVLLAIALAFILAIGLALVAPALPARFTRFQPPLRGPPAFA
ncbi:MAG: DUF2946 family protein [Novosphingobium sp.]|jgi:hypothetical protein|nr:hypothetical protein [Brevundimonas sp.]MCZ8320749.1 hypothetical protein [Novosphingobium sp.]